MALLLDDLLDVSRITRGKLELRREPVPLRSVVAAAVETARPAIDAKRHALSVELPVLSLLPGSAAVHVAEVQSGAASESDRLSGGA
jgi:signal transduction histidine kinase